MGNQGSAVSRETNNVRYPGATHLNLSTEALDMPPQKQYGKKKTGVSTAASKIFGSAAVKENESATGSRIDLDRSPLADVTLAVSNLKIDSQVAPTLSKPAQCSTKHQHETWITGSPSIVSQLRSSKYGSKSCRSENPIRSQDASSSGASKPISEYSSAGYDQDSIHNMDFVQTSVLNWIDSSVINTTEDYVDFTGDDPLYTELKPFLDAYRADCGAKLDVITWEDVFTHNSTVRKIAEASFAEVYKVTNYGGASLLKVIRVKTVHDLPSLELYNSSSLKALMSEVRIMNTMATVPGYVPFKSAKLVRGVTCDILTEASEEYFTRKNNVSHFKDPDTYTDSTVCLVIELAYAGNVLDEVAIDTANQVWDVLLGVIIALARGEIASEFEHRDLHENNICIAHNKPTEAAVFPDPPLKFGRSGLTVTLIDYGLSRATLATGEVAFFDFEGDKSIFFSLPENQPQFKAYRTMRHNLFTGDRTTKSSTWHKNPENDNSSRPWSEHIPYTNVVWINYILFRLRERYQMCGPDGKFKSVFREQKREMNRDLEEMVAKLGDRGEGFASATQVLEYVVMKGWVTEAQLEGIDASLLSVAED